MVSELLDVLKVEVKPDYVLLLEFENGEKRVFDMTPYMQKQLVPIETVYTPPMSALLSGGSTHTF